MRFASTPEHQSANRALVECILGDLWRLHGCNGSMDWTGAEAYLHAMTAQSHRDLRETHCVRASILAGVHPSARPFGRRGSAPRVDRDPIRNRRNINGELP